MKDLSTQLAAPFLKECHKARKLRGGGYYIYVPWEHYVDRLNQLLGLNWSITYSDPTVAGDYLITRAQLTIVWEGGVTIRDGVGTTHTFPERNEEGKEKIIGDPLKNATRDSLRDACYQFGMGRYLDNQSQVCQLIGVKNAEELYNQTRPKQQGQITRDEWERKQKAKNIAANQTAAG